MTMNTDNRFPLEDCFEAVDKCGRLTTEQFLDLIESEFGPRPPDPGDEHGAHETLDDEPDGGL
jgi:hypothetical protein